MEFVSSSGKFAPTLQRGEPKAESSQTLIPKATTKPATSHLVASSIMQKLLKFWVSLTKILSGTSVRDELPFEATGRPSCYVVLLHLIPVAAALVITFLNLYGYWIGKELSGQNSKSAPKELALQLTAKIHELLILSSLGQALLTHLLQSLAFGYGIPFGALTAATKFKNLSYLWSRDFWALCATKYPHRLLLFPLVLLCTILGIAIGPSSATALIPRLDAWHAGEAIMTLNTSSDLLWPLSLQAGASDPSICDRSSFGCVNSMAWDSIAANFFSYWGHTTTGGGTASPQRINVPSISSLRSMDIRLKDSVGPSSPSFTFVSVQHAVIGDMVNSFRFLTFPSLSAKCNKTWSPAICSYQDVSWFVSAMQPVVSTACLETQLKTSSVEFPIINHAPALPKTALISLDDRFANETQPQFRWVTFDDSQWLNGSIGAVVKLGTATNAKDIVCTIQAQWAMSTTSTTYGTLKYVIDSAVPGMEYSMLADRKYKGQTVRIDPQWAEQSIQSLAGSQTNTTAFEKFMSLGEASSNLSVKLETVLSVLFAEKMAHVGSGTIPLSISSKDLFLRFDGNLSQQDMVTAVITSAANKIDFTLKTSMTGYGYGLYTTTGLSVSILISIIVLFVYTAIAIVHLASLYISEKPYIESLREERDMLVTCLRSRYRPAGWRMDSEEEVGKGQEVRNRNVAILRNLVVLTSRKGQAELLFRRRNWPDEI